MGFRERLIEPDLDRRLIERTVELAAATKGFGARALRAALDSSPLWGAGRVEDTFNLMGHALRKALGVIAVLQGRGQAAGITMLAQQAGTAELAASSLKAALDRDWDDPAARDEALAVVLGMLGRVEAFLAGLAGEEAAAGAVAGGPPGPRPGRGPGRASAGAAPRGRQRPADQRGRRRDAARPQVPVGAVRRLQAARAARPGHGPGRSRGGSPRPTRQRPASPATSPPTWTPPG